MLKIVALHRGVRSEIRARGEAYGVGLFILSYFGKWRNSLKRLLLINVTEKTVLGVGSILGDSREWHLQVA